MDGNIGNLLIVMNLLLRPLNDVNDVTWSIVSSLIILLIGVGWVIKYILSIDAMEAEQHGSDDTPKQEELLQLQSDGDQSCS